MGSVPDWYPVLRAAKYLGVAPWALLEQPGDWLQVALDAEAAEHEAERTYYARRA